MVVLCSLYCDFTNIRVQNAKNTEVLAQNILNFFYLALLFVWSQQIPNSLQFGENRLDQSSSH